MAKTIVLFNHKSGVGKTTTTLNLGWKLAQRRKKVLLADFDPQCNLTGMILDFKGSGELAKLYSQTGNSNIKEGLSSAFESRPIPLKHINCVTVSGAEGLYLLPGHIGLSQYEITLGVSQGLSGSIQALQNLPGSISHLLHMTAEHLNADYTLVDTSPSLNSLNRNLLMTCDYFLVPTGPDFYSVMAIETLADILPNWVNWARQASELNVLKEASYPFPRPHPKFLGTVIQRCRPREGMLPARGFQDWIDRTERHVSETLVPTLAKIGMMLEFSKYSATGIRQNFTLAEIPDLDILITASQRNQKPIYALTADEIGSAGTTPEGTAATQKNFDSILAKFADNVIHLTSND